MCAPPCAQVIERYNFPFDELNGEEIVNELADRKYQGNAISAADKLLGDFRKGLLGTHSSLEYPLLPLKSRGRAGANTRSSGAFIEDEEDNVPAPRKMNLDVGKGNYEGW